MATEDREPRGERAEESQSLTTLVRGMLQLHAERKKRVERYQRKLRHHAEEKSRSFLKKHGSVPEQVADPASHWLEDPAVRQDEWFELRVAARHLAGADPRLRERVLTSLPASLEEALRARLWVFRDILRMDNRSVQRLLRGIEPRTLAAALYGAEPELTETIRRNLSSRASRVLDDEREYLGELEDRDVQAARSRVVEHLSDLIARREVAVH